MKLLLVNAVDPWTRSVSTIHNYVAAGRSLGHSVAMYGNPIAELPELPCTTDLRGVDAALFIVQVPSDFPDMPHLARILDELPRERRVVVDLWGRFNDTLLVGHDFNHLEKLDGHLGWEWIEAIQAVSDVVLQPTFKPRRSDVRPFLFHAYDPGAVANPHATARAAAAAWREKPYGVVYVGSNWQRWDQVRPFLEQYGRARGEVGRACLVGWDWDRRPDWAIEKGIVGVDVDAALLTSLDVEIRHGVPFDQVTGLLGQGRFSPIFHRPLFRELGFVTVRTFETFHADTLPVLMLPRDFVQSVYGPAALALVPGEDLAAHLADAMRRPELYWDAVLETRSHLARHHSYARRFEELATLLGGRGVSEASR